jgi:hypothetical protein
MLAAAQRLAWVRWLPILATNHDLAVAIVAIFGHHELAVV